MLAKNIKKVIIVILFILLYKNMIKKDCKTNSGDPVHIKLKIWGTAIVWPKGQVVIPKEIRDNLNIKPWDSILFIYTWDNSHVWIIKNDNLQTILDFVAAQGIKVEIN